MNTHLPLLVLLTLLVASPCRAGVLEDMWAKYAPRDEAVVEQASFPGRVLGKPDQNRETVFRYNWRYRAVTYELHYDEPTALARTVYGLALHSGDIDDTLAPERFIGGVLGYHYSTDQVCAWLNDILDRKSSGPAFDENILVGMLLQDGVIGIKDGRYRTAGKVTHILAAAPGKKRQFDANLRHERLHIFWDEDKAFRDKEQEDWKNLSESARAEALKKLARYASGNQKQLIEEWAIARAESSNMNIE